jgi:hypothetical protein
MTVLQIQVQKSFALVLRDSIGRISEKLGLLANHSTHGDKYEQS